MSQDPTLNDYPLPDWATKRSDGNYMEVGAQLATRDGRTCGNGFVHKIKPDADFNQLAVVITDAGNVIQMTESELREQFYPPKYILDVDEARIRFLLGDQTP